MGMLGLKWPTGAKIASVNFPIIVQKLPQTGDNRKACWSRREAKSLVWRSLVLTKVSEYVKMSEVVEEIIGKAAFQLQATKLENGRGWKTESRL